MNIRNFIRELEISEILDDNNPIRISINKIFDDIFISYKLENPTENLKLYYYGKEEDKVIGYKNYDVFISHENFIEIRGKVMSETMGFIDWSDIDKVVLFMISKKLNIKIRKILTNDTNFIIENIFWK